MLIVFCCSLILNTRQNTNSMEVIRIGQSAGTILTFTVHTEFTLSFENGTLKVLKQDHCWTTIKVVIHISTMLFTT